jgi:hypothetical protein
MADDPLRARSFGEQRLHPLARGRAGGCRAAETGQVDAQVRANDALGDRLPRIAVERQAVEQHHVARAAIADDKRRRSCDPLERRVGSSALLAEPRRDQEIDVAIERVG